MKKVIAILGLALAAMSFAAPSYSADVNKKSAQVVTKQDSKAAKETAKQTKEAAKKAAKKAKEDAKALAKQKKEQQKAAKKAAKVAKKEGKKTPKAHAVPEIDGSYAALAISLLAGMVAIRRERYRKA